MVIDSIGRVGIGTATPTFGLDVNGTARVSGNFDAGSIGATTTSNRTTGQGVYLDNTANGGRLFGYNWATNTHRNLFIGLTPSVITSFGTQTAPVRSEGVQFMTSAYSNSTMTFAGAFNSLTFVNNTGGFGYVSGTNSNYPSFESNAIGILSSNSASLPIYLAGSKLNIQIGNGTNSKVAEFTTSGNLLMQKGGTFTDVPSSIFTATSTTQGLLIPRMTLTQRNAIASPAAGLQVYNTTTNTNDVFNGTTWAHQPLIVTNRLTANYTLDMSDIGDLVELNVGTANTLTVPLNSSVAFPIGTKIDVAQYGAGQTTITAAGGVTIRSFNGALKITGQYGAATLVKIGTNEWYCFGNLSL
jgi:hypothetical protein